MDLNEAKKLKEQGDKAKEEGKLEEALDLYGDAYHMAKEITDTTLAEILANTAQIKLEQKEYQHAFDAANDSLAHDSKLVKSLFARAEALDKLGHTQEATADLRRILEVDPVNTIARKMLRGIAPSVKMNPPFFDCFVIHFLRRFLYKACDSDQESKTAYWRSLKVPLMRISFLTIKTARSIRRVLVGASVIEDQSETGSVVKLKLPSWFVLKHLKYGGNLNSTVNVLLSRKSAVLLLHVVKTGGITLMFSSESFASDFLQGYTFSFVIYKDENSMMVEDVPQAGVELIKKVSKSLTRLPYFLDVSDFKEPKFPQLHTVLIGSSEFSIDFKFLKAWYEYVWPTKQIVFSEPIGNLTVFKSFIKRCAVSETVVKAHFALSEEHLSEEINQLPDHFKVLKKAFPELRELVGFLKFDFTEGKDLAEVSDQLKKYLHFFAGQINKKVKPGWCQKLKILIKMECDLGIIKEINENAGSLICAVEDCKKTIKNAKSVQLHGPSAIDFDWNPNNCCFAMVEAVTDDASIQVSLAMDC